MNAWLIVAIAAALLCAGWALSNFWPSYDSPQNIWGAWCVLAGAVIGLLALGWALYVPYAGGVMLAVLIVAGVLFCIGLVGAVALGMAPAPSMEPQWSVYLLLGSSVVGLFALGWNSHGWILDRWPAWLA